MRQFLKRTTAYCLTLLLLLTTLSPAGFAISGGSATLGDATIDVSPTVSYNPTKNEYTLQMKVDAVFYEAQKNTDPSVPKRGYFTANYTGWYLVELWGANGADGLDDGARLGGEGGQGGYIYAKVYLTEGETLYYSLGGNGSVGYKTGQGGGANGGGGGGSAVTYGVGGGGGYSALFLFEDSAYFAQNYLDENLNFVGDNISEYDRNTKYLMIAGGGGGGGAGNGASLSGANKWTADGGSGGNMQSSISGPVTGSGTTVAGTFYAGANGTSSGTNNSYIGKGATTVPGSVSGTIWNWSNGEKPNDWTGAYNASAAGGAGGAGNLRGGGGGAGYCGGSGGVQESLVNPVNVGGGGGGSSFVAASANGKPVVTNTTDLANPAPEDGLTAHEMGLLDGLHSTPDSGAVAITYLADEYQSFSHMESLAVSFTVSKYFNVTGFQFSQSHTDASYPTGYNFTYAPKDNGEVDVVLYDINLLPTEQNLRGELDITLKFQPKNVFVGGNDVPLLAGDCITVTETTGHERASCTIALKKNNCYVNVPLKFTVDTLNHNYNSSKTLAPSDLYGGYYDGIREELANHFVYDFISSISPYTVEGMPAEGMEISQTTRFPVSITVTPKNDPTISSSAGPECGITTFTTDAIVTILEQHQGHLNGVTMNYIKSLTYNADGTYTYTIHTTAANDRLSHLPNPDTFDENASGGGEFIVAHDGYYLVQAWGGSGHEGQTASGLGGTRDGGAGGKGGYVYVYLPLKKGDKLILSPMGQMGAEPDNSKGLGGGGGTYTAIRVDYLESNYEAGAVPADIQNLVIAGGGGGGGNGIAGSWIGLLGADGKAGGNSTTVNSTLQNLSNYNGGTGKVGSSSGLSYTGGAGGAGAPSYYFSGADVLRAYDASVLDKVTQEEFDAYIGANTNPNTSGGGGAKVTCLQLLDHSHVATDLTGYELDLQFSRYFDIVEGSLTGVNNGANALAAGQSALVYDSTIENNLVCLSGINPYQDTVSTEEGNAAVYNTTVDFTFTIRLRPKDAFLGGNDVPLLTEAQMRHTITHEEETHTDTAHILLDNEADFANVRMLLTEDDLGTLTGLDVHLEESTIRPVELTELYTYTGGWPNPTGENAWTGDFVQNFATLSLQSDPDVDLGDGPFTVDRNTYYFITVGLYSPGPYKAKVGPEAEPLSVRDKATIFVRPRIIYNLTDITTSDVLNFENYTGLDPATDHTATLTAMKGFKLPDTLTITYNDNGQAVPFSYDSSTGRFTIEQENIRSMTVTASGVRKSFTINYAYETPGTNTVATHTETYLYGQDVTHWDYYGDDITGYDFAWRWYTESEFDGVSQNGDIPATMPARDLWVVGNYTPQTYTLQVQYLFENGTVAAAPVAPTEYVFDSSYSFASPAISGFASDKPLLSGTVDEALVTGLVDGATVVGNAVIFTVVYSPTANQLRINYIYEDTGAINVFRTEAYKTGDSYTVPLTVPQGYTAYLDGEAVTQITGTMAATGAVYDVYYRPNQITITFSYDKENGGNCTEDSRVVLYNGAYGYCVQEGETSFISLPTQVLRAGHAFTGWYLDLNNPDSRVTNDTIVTLTENHTLYAKWETKTYALVVEHMYINGSAAAPAETYEIAYDASYSVSAKTIAGYSAHILVGTDYVLQSTITEEHMPAQTVVRTFFYIGNEYPLTIRYLFGDSKGPLYNTPAATPYQANVVFGESYSVPSPTVKRGDTEYECSMPSVEGVMDVEGGKTITVYYYELPPVISVTVEWGSMIFVYDRGPWNPETHLTENGLFLPHTGDANRVSVKNNKESTISVAVSLSYEVDPYHSGVAGYFTATDKSAAEHITAFTVDKNKTGAAWLWLSGRVADTFNGTATAGKCMITITGGG